MTQDHQDVIRGVRPLRDDSGSYAADLRELSQPPETVAPDHPSPTAAPRSIARDDLYDLIWTEVLGAFREAKRAHRESDFPPGTSVAKRSAGALVARLTREGLVLVDG
jgi:hypothetical protein